MLPAADSSTPVANTISGWVVLIVAPTLVILLSTAIIAGVRWVGRAEQRWATIDNTLAIQNSALSALLGQVSPTGQPSLVERLATVSAKQDLNATLVQSLLARGLNPE